jgi:hypothetical protein
MKSQGSQERRNREGKKVEKIERAVTLVML